MWPSLALFHRRSLLALAAASAFALPAQAQKTLEWRYGHMNPPGSAAGMQAQWLAEEVAKRTNGGIKVTVYPSSQLGKLQELAEAVSTGTIALSHNTAAAIGSLHAPFAALDTPYLYRDVDHLMKVMDVNSPVMKQLNDGLVKDAGVRVLYAYYFGTRHLTTNKAVKQPADLAGQKIRAIPFPIYMTTVEAMGAVPVPVDWSEVPTALATGKVNGQENPVNVVLSSKLYESQSHLMQTGHIMNAQVIVVNERSWQSLSPQLREQVSAAAAEVRRKATEMVRGQEAAETEELKKHKMTIIGPAEGLDLAAFRSSVRKAVDQKFGAQYGNLYKAIEATR
ncbi:MAG: TRAP transporter substrate-binding protein [Hydrogenophaga sp.]|uniref:TRAP transporter substrate-binding protein n=1 Tax=Hydrogenophaga sp. TaxID=1904254 RepID=UPI00261789A1|nr:TRAP transporter substrate-binding protein [Hydrogenophaga sp.]MCV0439577.1 TRAP transporter substrate-binding protein [Hydrogenophaga sp.]